MKIATMERMNDQIEKTLETLRKENQELEKTLEMLDSKPITKDTRKRYGMIERQISRNCDIITAYMLADDAVEYLPILVKSFGWLLDDMAD